MSEPSTQWAVRTSADLTSLLLELARALRGLAFYAESDPHRAPLVDRAHRAVASELSRAGPIDLRIDEAGFHLVGLEQPVRSEGVLAELEAALVRHRLERVRLDPTLTRHALHGLLDLLCHPRGRYETPRHFARVLAAREASGIALNELDVVSEPIRRKLSATPPRASASLGASLLQAQETSTGAGTAPRTISSGAGEDEKPSLDAEPLLAPAGDDRGERLRARLIELDQTVDDEAYGERAAEIVRWAEDLWEEELADECYRALLVLADHAVGFGGRSESQARAAAASFAQLARGELLDDLIERACGRPGGSGVRAAQLLLQLGRRAAPAIFDRICSSETPERTAPLAALILALGEASLPSLIGAIEGPDDDRARAGIRLAGELQSPEVLPVLIKALRVPSLGRRLETIRALSLLPGEASKAALERALASELDEIVVAATSALADSDGPEAVPTLLEVLDATLHTSRTHVCIQLVEVLGRVGDERAVPRLASVLERRPMLRRAHWHSIQLAAVEALASLPSREARRCLERAAQQGARPVRERARRFMASFVEEA